MEINSSQMRTGGIVIAIAVIVFFAFKFFGGTDAETAIHARLDELEEIARKTGKESTIEGYGKARRAANFMVERPYIELLPGMNAVDDRDQLAGVLASMRNYADTIEVSFSSRQIDVADSGDAAFVVLYAKANGSGMGDSRSYNGKYRMNWVEEDGEWLITKVERIDD